MMGLQSLDVPTWLGCTIHQRCPMLQDHRSKPEGRADAVATLRGTEERAPDGIGGVKRACPSATNFSVISIPPLRCPPASGRRCGLCHVCALRPGRSTPEIALFVFGCSKAGRHGT